MALDVRLILCFESEAGNGEFEEILNQAGAMRAIELNPSTSIPAIVTATAMVNENGVFGCYLLTFFRVRHGLICFALI